jgi:hypothetical protein
MTDKVQNGEPLIAPGKAWMLLGVLLAGFALLCALSVLLPNDPYVRYQQFDQSDLFKLRWVYERIHFDPTPIDVAIIGSSRVEAALSGPELEASLSEKLGRPIHVTNLAVPYEGRNVHYILAKELLAYHPETKLILLSVVERADITHPAFRYISSVSDVLHAPMWINHYYVTDAAFLPYRQISFFVQSLFPSWFEKSTTFRKDYLGSNWDSTQSFRTPTGRLIDRYLVASPQKLADGAAEMKSGLGTPDGHWVQPSAWYALNAPLEPEYTARLSSMAKERGARVVFVHLPFYSSIPGQYDHASYERLGPLLDAQQFSTDPHSYADVGHFNRYGIAKVSPWLDSVLEPYMDSLRSSNVYHR